MIYIIFGVSALVSWLVQRRLKSKFAKYSQMQLAQNLSGEEVARLMLADHGLHDVKVISVNGQLTDHYNPVNRTVNLSESVYHQRNAAAAAVAAHECGHAVQHATAYSWLTMRSKLVPMVGVSSKFSMILIIGGFILLGYVGSKLGFMMAAAGVVLFGITTLFAFITLPVEYDASNRALAWIEKRNVVTSEEHAAAKDALKWAARTYVVAALSSLATLLYYVMLLLGRSSD